MVKIIERFICDTCGTIYTSRAIAEICEGGLVPTQDKFHVGSKVKFDVDHTKYKDTIKSIVLRAGIVGHFRCATEDQVNLDALRHEARSGHEWCATFTDPYDHDGQEITHFPLDRLMPQ